MLIFFMLLVFILVVSKPIYIPVYLTIEEEHEDLFRRGIIDKNFAPLKCHICGCESFDIIIIDTIAHVDCEIEYDCTICGTHCGYWAYGYWQP